MKYIIALLFLSLNLCFQHASGQVKITKTYTNESIDLFSSEKYKNAITRQHSITINLKDFVFTEIRDGDYILSLKIRFLKYQPGSGTPEVKKEINTVFYDDKLIRTYEEVEEESNGAKQKKKKSKKHIQLTLKDQLLAFNYKLIDVSHIEVMVRMTKVKDEYEAMINMINPILNVAVKSNETVKLVENLLDNIQSDETQSPLLFRGEIYIPANIFDYEQKSNSVGSRIVDNNEEFAIILNGKTPINDNSLKGKSVEVINRITKFIYGKKELRRESVKMNGMISLSFTKDDKPVIPDPIMHGLNELEGYLEAINLASVKSEFDATRKETFKIIEFARNSENISPSTYYDISQFLKLAQFYYLFVSADNQEFPVLQNGTKGPWSTKKIKGSLVRSYKRWHDNINLKGAANDVQAIGIQGIYTANNLAKIFIPSGLSDFNTMSFFLWQKAIHEIMADNNNLKLAEKEN